MYKKALAGEITNFTGVDDPYEAPTDAEIVLDTDIESVDESVEKVLRYLNINSYL
jgi:adenylylsulfate kinase